MAELNQRWFGGRPIYAELSPVTDFREACCRELEKAFYSIEAFFNVMRMYGLNAFWATC